MQVSLNFVDLLALKREVYTALLGFFNTFSNACGWKRRFSKTHVFHPHRSVFTSFTVHTIEHDQKRQFPLHLRVYHCFVCLFFSDLVPFLKIAVFVPIRGWRLSDFKTFLFLSHVPHTSLQHANQDEGWRRQVNTTLNILLLKKKIKLNKMQWRIQGRVPSPLIFGPKTRAAWPKNV